MYHTSIFSQLGDSALLEDDTDLSGKKDSLPQSFVPGRNILFLTIAAAHCYKHNIGNLWCGVNQTDYSGYPDCRKETIFHLERALQNGMDTHINLKTPLMYLSKAQIFLLAKDVGILPMVVDWSHTCYNGDHETKHDWGYGCAACPACLLRKKGWEEAWRREKQ